MKEYKVTTNGAKNIYEFAYLFVRVEDDAILRATSNYEQLMEEVKEFALGKAVRGEHIHITIE